MINRAGDIVLVDYATVNSGIARGLFLVLYDEATDNSTQHGGNFTALKITTSIKSVSSYYVTLGNDNELRNTSYVVCNKIQTFSKTQVVGHIGKISKADLVKVYTINKLFLDNMQQQLLASIAGIKG